MAELFGFEFKRKIEPVDIPSFTPKAADDGAMVVAEGGVYGTFVDLDGAVRTEAELVNKYREVAMHPEVEMAIDDIVNEAIVADPKKAIVSINLDDLEQPDKIKKMIMEEFDTIVDLLEFNQHAYEIFKKWYVDGRLLYHAMIDEDKPREGIKELRYIDPRKIRKVRTVKKRKVSSTSNVTVPSTGEEFYIYNEKGFSKTAGVPNNVAPFQDTGAQGLKIAVDSIVNVSSGLVNVNGDLVIGYLQKAIKPLNMLKAMEDSLVIYRISRAPERRIFYIDVGNLPKPKAEQYLRDVMTRFKNKVVYDSATGEIRDDRKHMTMLEDFWLPRREGGKGTEITTLPGGQNLGQMDDVTYFQNKLYKSLNVPIGRMDPSAQYSFGRATEITRDEVKFAKFVTRLRMRFSDLFVRILEKQLILKGVITSEDWAEFKTNFKFEYAEDNHFAELRNTEILRDRVSMLRDVDDYASKYFSHEWIRRNVLHQTEEDMKEIDEQIKEEMNNPQYNSSEVGPDGQPIPVGGQPPPGEDAGAPPAPPGAKPPKDADFGPAVPDVVKKPA
jgi:hypothetical protein